MTKTKPRILIAKIGLDGHDRGAKYIARSLRDAGMEVIYTGTRLTGEEITQIALQEDVHVIGISILSGAHNHLLSDLIENLKKQNINDKIVICGGIIPEKDHEYLYSIGLKAIFTPGTKIDEIIEFINKHV
jgi:methylmalonyl-CoA mutase C-terminal domain/subunit